MDQDHNIRLKLQASMEGKNVVAEQLNSLLSIEKQLTEQNYKLAEAAKTRAAAVEASASRERALVQGVVSIQGELAEANRRAEEAAKRAAEAAKARAEANKREAEREKGILESLKAKYAEVEKARERAMSHKEIRQYNAQLSDLQRQIARVDGGMRGLGQTTVGTSNQFRTLHNYATAALSTAALTQFGNKLKDVTSNAESFGISLETMLQSKLNADKLNSQVIDFAKRTPFTLGEVQEQTTKLLAYNIASGDVVKTIEELGNIAAGVGKEKLPFLTLAYGQVRALGRLTGQEVRQFTEAGVPLLELLAKQSGKTTAQIQKDVTEGAVSFEMVKAAISSTSAEGGKFFNLMGKQSQTLAGRLSNFSDTVDQGLVRVGNRIKQTGMNLLGMADDFIQASLGSESAVNRTISYVKALIAMYVTYRAVSAAITVQKRLEVAADLELVGSHRLLYAVTGQLNLAQQGLWATLRANPIGLIVGAIGLAVTAYQLWKGASTEVVSAIGEEEGKLRAERDTLNALTSAVVTANAANGERIRVLKNLNEQYPDLLRGLDLEKVSNRELVNILAAVNREYKNRIENARLAYQAEQNGEKRKEMYQTELDLINRLKEADANFKPISRDIAGVIREAQSYIKRTAGKNTDPYIADLISELELVKPRARQVSETMQELDSEDRAISNEKQKRNEAQEKFEKRNYDLGLKRIKQLESELKGSKNLTEEQRKEKQQQLDAYLARKKQYEEQHGLVVVNGQKEDKAKKKWHDDDLVRRRAEVLAMEDSLAKRLLLINADERIAISKARFEKKTETEIDEIRAEYEEKRRKTLKDEREDRKKLSDDLLEHEKQIKDKILEQKKKELEEQKKLDAEYQKLLVEQAKLREEIGLEQARDRELREAKSLTERIAIERKYDNLVAGVHINSLQQEIFRENLRVDYQRKLGKLTENDERESRNRILKLENQIDEERRKLADKEANRQNAAAERRRQLERETTQMIIQLLSQTENAYLRGFANMLAAYQQFKDKRDKGEINWRDKTALGITVLAAASSAFFSAESERYGALAQAAAERNSAEMEALQKRNKADLDGFKGNELQKKQLQDRQEREEKALKEKQQKQEAALKLKQWKADQASKVSQTITSGALAGIQAYAQLGPIGGLIAAGVIGALTVAAVAKIASQKAPKFYATGTEFVDDKREFPSGIDTVPAYLTRGESVLTVQQNKRKQDLGLNNDGLLRTAELYQTLTSRHYFALEGKEYAKTTNPNEKMERLMEGVSRKLDNLKKTNITIDRRGFKVWEAEKNRRIQFLNNQYFGK